MNPRLPKLIGEREVKAKRQGKPFTRDKERTKSALHACIRSS